MLIMNSSLLAQPVIDDAIYTSPATVVVNGPINNPPHHLSCDGLTYRSGALTLAVFAWDNKDQGWAYDDGSIHQMSYYVNNISPVPDVIRPEIALVSINDGDEIYAVIVYSFDDGVDIQTYYEAYQWNGSAFPSTPTYDGVMQIVNNNNVVITAAGDQYGHLIIVNDDGTQSSAALTQLTAYIDSGTGNLVFGTQGSITFNSVDIWEPDADITFDNIDAAPNDARAYFTFITNSSIDVIAAAVDFRDLFGGGSYDTYTISPPFPQLAAISSSSCILSHPSIAVNDGYNAYQNSYLPHAAVAYSEDCSGDQAIRLFGVRADTFATSSIILNTTYTSPFLNANPTAVAAPYEIQSIVAWDFDDNSGGSGYYLEGLAHGATYTLATNTYASFTNDMQVQTSKFNGGTGDQNTTVTTASGLGENVLIYFYYDDAAISGPSSQYGKRLEYKVRPFGNSQLRNSKSINVSDNIVVYPNPVKSNLSLHSSFIATSVVLTDVIGRNIGSFYGNTNEIETALNSKIVPLHRGIYFLKLYGDNGISGSVKFIKE